MDNKGGIQSLELPDSNVSSSIGSAFKAASWDWKNSLEKWKSYRMKSIYTEPNNTIIQMNTVEVWSSNLLNTLGEKVYRSVTSLLFGSLKIFGLSVIESIELTPSITKNHYHLLTFQWNGLCVVCETQSLKHCSHAFQTWNCKSFQLKGQSSFWSNCA